MRAGKELSMNDEMMANSIFGLDDRKKTRKEVQIDKKIERLLEAYKRQDEGLLKKAKDKEANKNRN